MFTQTVGDQISKGKKHYDHFFVIWVVIDQILQATNVGPITRDLKTSTTSS